VKADLSDMTEPDPQGDLVGTGIGGYLTSDEDADLRQLRFLFRMGRLEDQSYERFVWLSIRDRRRRIQER